MQVVPGLPLNIRLPRNVKHSEIGFDELRCQVINLSVAVLMSAESVRKPPMGGFGSKRSVFTRKYIFSFLMNIDNIEFSKGGLDRHLS